MENYLDAVKYPELVIALAGAIGADMNELNRTVAEALSAVGYKAVEIRITREIANELTNVPKPTAKSFAEDMSYKMSHASELCRKHTSANALAVFAIRAIRKNRAVRAEAEEGTQIESKSERGEHSELTEAQPSPEEQVIPRTAFVIRQLKRPEEVELLRKVYGRQFILISAYASAESRKRSLETSIRRTMPLNTPDHVISAAADQLMYRDQSEDVDDHGQHLRETFPLADVFVDGVNTAAMSQMVSRFFDALFGRTDIAPTKSEYGMYAAKSASLRSSDLSRQVGAAIFTDEGELISQGCNEVPKAFGGTYWDGEEPDFRDVKLGHDPNDILKREVVRDLLERLSRGGLLSPDAESIGSGSVLVDALIRKPASEDAPKGHGSLVGSAIMDLTEYGRVVHAEMCAICDAARLGRAVKGATLYCTTFPCHNCTKHLLAAGIRRVVYIEPYPKSKAKELHENEIEIERSSQTRVSFLPFLGISPVRYRDIFQKGKRKKDGVALMWIEGEPRPMMNAPAPTYIDLEAYEYARLFGRVRLQPATADVSQNRL